MSEGPIFGMSETDDEAKYYLVAVQAPDGEEGRSTQRIVASSVTQLLKWLETLNEYREAI